MRGSCEKFEASIYKIKRMMAPGPPEVQRPNLAVVQSPQD